MSMTKQKRKWRDIYPVHPCAELFPRLSASEFSDLRKSLKEVGLRVPVVLWRDSSVNITYLLDGRNRLDAMEANGIKVIGLDGELLPDLCTTTDSMSSFGAAQMVFATNISRRHLNEQQRVQMAAAVLQAEKDMRRGTAPKLDKTQTTKKTHKGTITGGASPVIGKPVHQKGLRGSTKSLVGQVAEMAKVDRKTARKHLKVQQAASSTRQTPKRPKPQKAFLKFHIFLRACKSDRLTPADHEIAREIQTELTRLLKGEHS